MTVLVHLNIEKPRGDARTANEIADAILAAIQVGSDDESVRDLVVVSPMAEEIPSPPKRYLDARFDVSGLNDDEIGHLALAVVVQSEGGDNYDSVPAPETEVVEVVE